MAKEGDEGLGALDSFLIYDLVLWAGACLASLLTSPQPFGRVSWSFPCAWSVSKVLWGSGQPLVLASVLQGSCHSTFPDTQLLYL